VPVIDTNGQRVSYTDSGRGMAVVFVPGIVGSRDWFCYQSAGLSDHYRVITYDLRKARGGVNYSLQLLTDDLARFLTAIHVHVAVIAGYSFGGLIAMRFAAIHPDRCLALVLASTTPRFPDLVSDELLSHLVPGGVAPRGFFARLKRRLFGPKEADADDSDPLTALRPSVAELDRATLDARLGIVRETDMTPALGELSAPALVMAGSRERSYVLSGSQTLDQEIQDSTLEVIEDSDSYYFYTRHDVFNSIVEDYLSHKIARL